MTIKSVPRTYKGEVLRGTPEERKREYARRYHADNRESRCANAREWSKNNPEKRNAAARKRRTPKFRFRYLLKYHYGISEERYYEMLRLCGGLCEICRRPQRNGRRLCVDHDHDSGVVRGLLCNDCNTAIGMMKESRTHLTAAISYLEKHGKVA